ncbi:MAG: SH3 domain-containing protein [Chloroflexi bacterium]|nr:SH3 domain-containing protein [Chloroflexota bacterium]
MAAAYFLLRAVSARSQTGKESYGFGQLEARQAMQMDFIRAVMAVLLGLIFFAVFAVAPSVGEMMPEPAFVPTLSPTDSAEAAATATPAATATVTPVPFPTSQVTVLPTVMATLAATPTHTPEPAPATAVVTSPVGVYLRSEPSTSAPDVEWLLEGTQLVVLPGDAEADGYTWIFVRTPAGNEGWVATAFIELTP